MPTANVGTLVVRLVGEGSSFQRTMTRAQASVKSFSTSILSLKTLLPVAAIGYAVREFAKFDQALTESTAIMGASAEQAAKMAKAARAISKDARQSAEELARSYYFLASAGLNAEQSIKALPVVSKFATAGMFDMSRATDLLTDAQSALGLTVSDTRRNIANMTRVSDVLVRANTLANASVEQFSIALTSKAGSSLKTYNKTIEEGVAVLAAMADQGIKAELAGNNLSRVMLLLAKSAQDQAKEHENLKFRVYDATGTMRNFADIIKNLEDIMRGMTDEQKSWNLSQLGFEARIQAAILPLIGLSDKIREYEERLEDAGGTTAEVANKQMQSFSSQLKVTKNRVSLLASAIGEELAPSLRLHNSMLQKTLELPEKYPKLFMTGFGLFQVGAFLDKYTFGKLQARRDAAKANLPPPMPPPNLREEAEQDRLAGIAVAQAGEDMAKIGRVWRRAGAEFSNAVREKLGLGRSAWIGLHGLSAAAISPIANYLSFLSKPSSITTASFNRIVPQINQAVVAGTERAAEVARRAPGAGPEPIVKNTRDTADHTKDIADKSKMMLEQLKRIADPTRGIRLLYADLTS